MVDEPWDGLKGEVGPVLASIAPFAAMTDEARPDVWLWLPGVALLLLAACCGAEGDGERRWLSGTGARLGLGSVGNVSEGGKNGTRLSTGRGFWYSTNTAVARVNGQPASVDVYVSLCCACWEAAGKPFRFARQPEQGLA